MQLQELVKCIRPGDQITNESWPAGRTFTVSTEFMKFHTGRGIDTHERNSCPSGTYDGWSVAGLSPTALSLQASATTPVM